MFVRKILNNTHTYSASFTFEARPSVQEKWRITLYTSSTRWQNEHFSGLVIHLSLSVGLYNLAGRARRRAMYDVQCQHAFGYLDGGMEFAIDVWADEEIWAPIVEFD